MRALILAAALAATAGPVLAQAPAGDPIQQQFVVAMQALESGRPDQATPILMLLASRTDAPRIRLELARALYLEGRLKEARTQFLRVYAMSDLPYAVRRTVNVFLFDIDQRAGYIEPRLTLSYDSNPQFSASSGVYDIFGLPLQYESTAKPEVGLRMETSGAFPVERLGVSLIGGAAVTAYRNDDLGQYALNGGVRRLDSGQRGWTGAGVTYFERRGQDPAITSFVERVQRITLPGQSRQLVGRASLNHTSIRNQNHLDSWGGEGALEYGFDLSPNSALSLTATLGYADAKYEIDARAYANLVGSVTVAAPRWNKTMSLRAGVGNSRYGGIDPFFSRRREDRSYNVEARLVDGRPIRGLFPSVALTWDHRASSIAFFDYQQAGVALGLQRRF